MRPAYHFEPKCNITVSTREEWNKGPDLLLYLRGLSVIHMGPGRTGGLELASSGDPGEG